jgi:D-aspartate ligase
MKQYRTDFNLPYALVIDLNSINGLQTARILAKQRIPVIAIAKDLKHFTCRTNVCQRIIEANTENEDFITALIELGPTLPQKAVLFPCTDINVLLVSEHRQQLSQWYHIMLPPFEIVELLLNKLNFYAFAQEKGLPIPQTWILHNRAEAEAAGREAIFPCALKPPVSATAVWQEHSKLKAYKITSMEELLEVYDQFSQWAEVLILQQWINGPDTNLFTCNCYFSRQGEPLITFVSRKIRQWPPVTGEGCLSIEEKNETLERETLRLFKTVPYQGLGYLEMKRDELSGEYFITEPNIGRPTGRSAIAEAGGVPLLYTMYCEAVGLPLPANREQRYEGVKWIYFRRDLQAALYNWRQGNMSLKEWWQSIQGQKTDAIFDRQDWGPFIGDWIRSIRFYLSTHERRKRDYGYATKPR